MMTLDLITLLFGNLGLSEVLIIAFVVLLLFGGKKIPELMRGIGKGVSSFKQGMNDIQDEITKPVDSKADADKE
jgi:twin arginine-targeting protein translocase, tatA/E family